MQNGQEYGQEYAQIAINDHIICNIAHHYHGLKSVSLKNNSTNLKMSSKWAVICANYRECRYNM